MVTRRHFPRASLTALDHAKIIGIRAGTEHRFTGVWAVVAGGRVFVRSWNNRPGGWYRAFLEEPRGTVAVGDLEIRVRGRTVRGERILDAIDRAYAEKYHTPASRKWVRGFARPGRRQTTLELLPR